MSKRNVMKGDTKRCSRCRRYKHVSKFWPRARRPKVDGSPSYLAMCKQCRKTYRRHRYKPRGEMTPQQLKEARERDKSQRDKYGHRIRARDRARYENKRLTKKWKAAKRKANAKWREGLKRDPVRLEKNRKLHREWMANLRRKDGEKLRAYQRRMHMRRMRKDPAYAEKIKLKNIETKYGKDAMLRYGTKPAPCEACGVIVSGRRRHIDHCHRTGVVRGILCIVCNHALGSIENANPGLVRYMLKHGTHIGIMHEKE